MLLDPGDCLLVEEYSFTAAADSIASLGLCVVPLRLDDCGIHVASLRTVLRGLQDQGVQVTIVPTARYGMAPRVRSFAPCRQCRRRIKDSVDGFSPSESRFVGLISDLQPCPSLRLFLPSCDSSVFFLLFFIFMFRSRVELIATPVSEDAI